MPIRGVPPCETAELSVPSGKDVEAVVLGHGEGEADAEQEATLGGLGVAGGAEAGDGVEAVAGEGEVGGEVGRAGRKTSVSLLLFS